MKHWLKNNCILLLALFVYTSYSAAHAVTLDWAVISNSGNAADDTGYGAVEYEYRISTTEVTTSQYVEFLNAVAAIDTYGLYNTDMADSTYYKGIIRSGNSGSYTYSANAGWENKPVVYVSWYDTLRFANWLHNGQPIGSQDASTTEAGAYTFSAAETVSSKNIQANFWLPDENEWYKAAYYNFVTATYYDYATASDSTPDNNSPDSDSGNSANYYDNGYSVGSPFYSTDVGAYTLSASPYGTYDQNGNVFEWLDTIEGIKRIVLGSAWDYTSVDMLAGDRGDNIPTSENQYVGFRVASSIFLEDETTIPEPVSIGLLLLSLGGFFVRKSKRA